MTRGNIAIEGALSMNWRSEISVYLALCLFKQAIEISYLLGNKLASLIWGSHSLAFPLFAFLLTSHSRTVFCYHVGFQVDLS